MHINGLVKKGEYYDSVTLMMAARRIAERPGVVDSAVVMATTENKAILAAAGLMLDAFGDAGDTDLVVVVKAEEASVVDDILANVGALLRAKRGAGAAKLIHPRTLEGGLQKLPGANLALISVAGRYAGDEAMAALKSGLHVMLFSDNVSIEQEIELKRYAKERGLLMMGPDSGTAIINGVPLAFANVVRRGDIGVVAASGTGLQEVTTLISNAGGGISQAIGTGGRDVKEKVGGLTFIEATKALLADERTRVLLFVSKPPHESVLKKIAEAIRGAHKPIVATFLGADRDVVASAGMVPAATLAEGALKAVCLSRGDKLEAIDQAAGKRDAELRAQARAAAKLLKPEQRFVRGLFSGGTFCSEAQVMYRGRLAPIFSNAPYGGAEPCADALRSVAHTIIDLGEDEFTVGRPHPMIDFSLRNKRIVQEAADPEAAVILLDLVLGYGSHPDPVPDIVPVLEEALKVARQAGRHLVIATSVTGTDGDPQNRSAVAQAVERTGTLVFESNAAACAFAGYLVEGRS
jgi:succinyl-CoA synthetase alpha subunit